MSKATPDQGNGKWDGPDRQTLRLRDRDGNHLIVPLNEKLFQENPDLEVILERIRATDRSLFNYGNSYERSGGHDKSHDKEPGHDRSHSKST